MKPDLDPQRSGGKTVVQSGLLNRHLHFRARHHGLRGIMKYALNLVADGLDHASSTVLDDFTQKIETLGDGALGHAVPVLLVEPGAPGYVGIEHRDGRRGGGTSLDVRGAHGSKHSRWKAGLAGLVRRRGAKRDCPGSSSP